MEEHEAPRTKGPTGDVDYDEQALRDAEQRMHTEGTGPAKTDDPDGTHDERALREAAERIGADREGT
jgi:hypothetical protein